MLIITEQDRSDKLNRFNTTSLNKTPTEATSLHVINRVLHLKKAYGVCY